ncbi:hypothetical protein [Tabrizicola sp.]|uniref:hypothetical protein n=1 Tax=Tabrizicola sp. TaxID=2005166 RepID=UPI00273531D0|nr:hypothetical protein [Tabrizicola sp.]MDP3196065.1 hypothetical protein [Tabrizicola sp.]
MHHPSPGEMLARGVPCGVEATTASLRGRDCLRLAPEPERRKGELGHDFGDEPNFLLLPETCAPAVIEADLSARLLPDAPDHARGFIGLGWNVQRNGDSFEALHLRPLNGVSLAPTPPRDQRGMQYFAYPDHRFDRLRATDPGRHEAAADIRPDTWHHLRIELGTDVSASVDGVTIFSLPDRLLPDGPGRLGLWVDIGTEGFFAGVCCA